MFEEEVKEVHWSSFDIPCNYFHSDGCLCTMCSSIACPHYDPHHFLEDGCPTCTAIESAYWSFIGENYRW